MGGSGGYSADVNFWNRKLNKGNVFENNFNCLKNDRSIKAAGFVGQAG